MVYFPSLKEKSRKIPRKKNRSKPATPKQTKACSCGQQWDTQSSLTLLLPESCPPSWGLHLGFRFTWTLSGIVLSGASCRESDLGAHWLAPGLPLKPRDASGVYWTCVVHACKVSTMWIASRSATRRSRIWTLRIKAGVIWECLNAEEQSQGDDVVL